MKRTQDLCKIKEAHREGQSRPQTKTLFIIKMTTVLQIYLSSSAQFPKISLEKKYSHKVLKSILLNSSLLGALNRSAIIKKRSHMEINSGAQVPLFVSFAVLAM